MKRFQTLVAIVLFGALLLLSAAAAPSVAASAAKPIVVDTDMAADDWMGLLYLLERPDVEVLAVAVSGTGEAHCKQGVANARGLLALARKPTIKVACGQETPLQGANVFPSDWRKASDAMLGIKLPANDAAAANVDASELLRQSLAGSEQKVTLVTLGPLTDVARLLEASPAVKDRIAMIYMMGGALDAQGNLGPAGHGNSTAEWNIFIDPLAALDVIKSGVPVTMIALDATRHAPVTMAFHDQLGGDRKTAAAEFVYQVLDRQKGFIKSGSWYFWDPMAAVAATDESVVTLEPRKITINVQKGKEFGRVVADESGSSVRVAVNADRNRLQKTLVNVLNGRAP